jgi:uncharacterized protein (DUF2147 family)
MIRMMSIAVMVMSALVTSTAGARTISGEPDGLWLNPHNSVAVHTGACGEQLCGWIVWANSEAISDAKDSGVSSLVGTKLLENYTPAGRRVWAGTVYVPDMGRRFASRIEQVSASALRVKGCILGGLICKSQTWTRIEAVPGDANHRS